MNKHLCLLLLTGCFSIIGFSQASKHIDTEKTVDFGKMPPVYFSNKIYWEKNFDKDNQPLFEGLKYNTCFIGAYIQYWPGGMVKARGQYVRNTTGNWAGLKERGLCSVQDGEWMSYNEDGELIHTTVYSKGKITSEN